MVPGHPPHWWGDIPSVIGQAEVSPALGSETPHLKCTGKSMIRRVDQTIDSL